MAKIKLTKIIYPMLAVAYMLAASVPTVYSINLFLKEINASFAIDSGKVDSQLIKLDLESLNFIAPRLKLDLEKPTN